MLDEYPALTDEGKASTARKGRKNFFTKDNLIALNCRSNINKKIYSFCAHKVPKN